MNSSSTKDMSTSANEILCKWQNYIFLIFCLLCLQCNEIYGLFQAQGRSKKFNNTEHYYYSGTSLLVQAAVSGQPGATKWLALFDNC